MNQSGRQNGKTSTALLEAPQRCVYVCTAGAVRYTKELARKLGREDIIVVGPDWIRDQRYLGQDRARVSVDHALDGSSWVEELMLWRNS